MSSAGKHHATNDPYPAPEQPPPPWFKAIPGRPGTETMPLALAAVPPPRPSRGEWAAAVASYSQAMTAAMTRHREAAARAWHDYAMAMQAAADDYDLQVTAAGVAYDRTVAGLE